MVPVAFMYTKLLKKKKNPKKPQKSLSQLVSQLTMHITVYHKEAGKVFVYRWQASVSTKNSVKYTTFSDKNMAIYYISACGYFT